jgi:hypothetical protein
MWFVFTILFLFVPFPIYSEDLGKRLENNINMFSSLYGDFKLNSKMNMLMPISFMLKRVSFCFGAFYFKEASINIPLFIMASTLNLFLVLH